MINYAIKLATMKFLLYILACLFKLSYTQTLNNCHEGLANVKKHLGSKTPYRFVSNVNSNTILFDDCTPEKIIGFIRHGTRTPSSKIIRKMKYDLPLLKNSIVKALSEISENGTLCKEQLDELCLWQYRVENDEVGKWLAHEGEDEMIDLAERLQLTFPQLLPEEYSNSAYYFRHTASQRTMQSARYFTIGLFGRYKISSVQFSESLDNDPVLRFYKLCDKWKKTVKKNPKALIEHLEFLLGPEVSKVCDDVSKRLGLNVPLPYDDIQLMYSACSFETAWNKRKTSPWCSVFSEFDFEILKYAADMKHYWRDGYGHELNYKIACPAINDAFTFLRSDDSKNASAVFYFTHSGTILKLLSHLGVYKDPFKLTANLSEEMRDSRKWRTSYIDAFGSNVIFILFNCGNDKKVLMLHQEKPILIPGCPHQLCPLSVLLNNFNDSLNNCNFNEMCSLTN